MVRVNGYGHIKTLIEGNTMKRLLAVLIVSIGFQLPAYAGPFTDEMAKCLIENTSKADKSVVIQWVYASMSFHPEVKSLANVSNSDGEAFNKNMAELMVDLTSVRCKDETVKALQYEGTNAMEVSFGLLGEVAMSDLMMDKDVQTYMSGLETYIDEEAYAEALGLDKVAQ
jgi:hypothetical protein